MYELGKLWDENYRLGRVNRYPYDSIVSFVFQEFGNERSELKGLNALELGFGGGNNLKFLSDLGINVHGIDAAPNAKKLAEELMGTCDDQRLIVGDMKELPYKEALFDFIIDRQSIGHNDEKDIQTILREAHRTLKLNGKFVSTIFGCQSSDLNLGVKRSQYTYNSFSGGNFCKSGMLTAFDIDKIKKTFGRYFTITRILRNLSENIFDSSIIEQYEVRMIKHKEYV